MFLREAAHEAGVARLLPVDFEVRDPAVDDDQRDWAFAEVLIGDAGAVDRPGPTCLGDVRHGALLRTSTPIAWPFEGLRTRCLTTIVM